MRLQSPLNVVFGLFRNKPGRRSRRKARRRAERLEARLCLSVYYDFDVVAETDAILTNISPLVGINDAGEVAFVGDTPTGDAIYVANGLAPPSRISATPDPGIFFDASATINDARAGTNQVATRERRPSSQFGSLSAIRRWDATQQNMTANVATTTAADPAAFNSFLVYTDINDFNDAVFVGVDQSVSPTVLPMYMRDQQQGGAINQLITTFPVNEQPRPKISNNREVVYRSSSRNSILMYEHTTRASLRIAGAPEGFTNLGASPGISKDGVVVVFYGDLDAVNAPAYFTNPGPGIFASVFTGAGQPRQITRVTGWQEELPDGIGDDDGIAEPGEPALWRAELGWLPGGAPGAITVNRFSSYSTDTSIGVIHEDTGAAGLDDDSFVVTFMATPSQASVINPEVPGKPLLFSDQLGIWSVRVDALRQLRPPNNRIFHPRSPLPVVQVNDRILQAGSSATITGLQIYDPIGLATRTQGGGLHTRGPSDHYIAFWANTDDGPKIVRAAQFDPDEDGLFSHWEVTGIDIDQDGVVDLDLRAMGADPFQKDIFLEVDWLYGNKPPVVIELIDSPDPVWRPGLVTLTALGVHDSDGTVAQVAFYRESDGIPGLNPASGGDQPVGTDTSGGDGWSTTFSTAALALGQHTYYAQATDDKGAASAAGGEAPSTVNTVRDRALVTSNLVGVDFEDPAVELNSPSLWATVTSSADTVNMTNLLAENNASTLYDLRVTTTVGTGIGTRSGDPAPASLPQHLQSLAGLDDFFFQTGSPTWTLIWEDLEPQLDYEVYVFGLTDQGTTQTVNIIGEGAAVRFDQQLTPGWLAVNSEQGDANRTLGTYAEVVRATQAGTIAIMVYGSPTPALAGLAIRPFAPPSGQTGTYLAATDDGELVRITAATGAVEHLGFTGEEISGLAVLDSGRVAGLDAATDDYYEIHPATYDAMWVGRVGLDVAPAMAYDRGGDKLYTMTTAAAGSYLVSIDPASGAGTAIGSGNAGLERVVSAAYDSAGQRVIVFDDWDNELYAIDPSTGRATRLAMAARPGTLFGMDEDTAGLLASYQPDPGTFSNLLLRVDPDTGVAVPGLVMSEWLRLNCLAFVPAPAPAPDAAAGAPPAGAPALADTVTDHVHEPAPGVTARLAKMFADSPVVTLGSSMGIKLHIDAGPGRDALGDPFSQNMGSGQLDGGDQIGMPGDPTAHVDVLYMRREGAVTALGVNARSMQSVKDEFFGDLDKRARELAFKYLVIADSHSLLNPANPTGTVTGGTADTITVSEDLGDPNGLKYDVIRITGGTGAGQTRVILGNTASRITVDKLWAVIPDSTSTYTLLHGSSGLSEVDFRPHPDHNSAPGNDQLLTLRGFRLNSIQDLDGVTFNVQGNTFSQWRTIAHELGHTLGLRHAGIDARAWRPDIGADDYRSLMSYYHQTKENSSVDSYSDTSDPTFNDWDNLLYDFSESLYHVGNSYGMGQGDVATADDAYTLRDYVNLNGKLPDYERPSVSLAVPDEIAPGSDLTVTVTATDDSRVLSVLVEFDVNGDGTIGGAGETVIAASTGGNTYRATFSAVGGTAGARVVGARAFDSSGNFGSAKQTVRVAVPAPGITVTPTSGLATTETGGAATFAVVLKTVPTASVTIGLRSTDPTEGTVFPASLTFTPGNARTPQTVTVTGVNDADVDGDLLYFVVTAAATSADGNYNGLDAADVSLTNTDDDTPLATLAVTSLTPTPTGFVAEFNAALDASELNLFFTQAGGLGAADVTLQGPTAGAVRGSVVMDASSRRLTFVQTVGVLAPDTYTVTLRSAGDGFKDGTGRLLDGNADGTPGDNFVGNFSVAAPPAGTVIVSLPSFARGFGQTVNVPASGAGMPLMLSTGQNVTRVDLTIRFNPQLLDINGFTPDVPGVSVAFTSPSPGIGQLTVSRATEFGSTGGAITLGHFSAAVPDAAPYGAKQILDITNLAVLDAGVPPGPLPSRDQDGLHVAAFFGDANGSRAYNAPDATLLQRVLVPSIDGFPAYRLVDPAVIGDIDRNDVLQTNDTASVQRQIVQIGVPGIPDLPSGLPTPTATGPDPRVFIPTNLSAQPGQTVTVPIRLETTEPGGITLSGMDLVVTYDASRFSAGNPRLGGLLSGFSAAFNSAIAGRLLLTASSPTGTGTLAQGTTGDLFLVDFTVLAGAPAGSSPLNLQAQLGPTRTALFDGALNELVLNPAPTDASSDAVDGRLTVSTGSALGAIHGYVFEDFDADGNDSSEYVLGGVPVFLDEPDLGIFDYTVTDDNGEYAFVDLPPGTYDVSVFVPDELAETTAALVTIALGNGDVYMAYAGQVATGPDEVERVDVGLAFGLFFLGEIRGYVFYDQDGDGVDDQEPRVGGLVIQMAVDEDDDGQIDWVATATTTGDTGEYSFPDMFFGRYWITPMLAQGQAQTTLSPPGLYLFSDIVYVAADDQADPFDPRYPIREPQLAFGLRSSWHNASDPYDVNDRDGLTAQDVLEIVNYINAHPGNPFPPATPAAPPPFYDVNGDGLIRPDDVLQVINEINRRIVRSIGGEAEKQPPEAGVTLAASVGLPPTDRVLPSSRDGERETIARTEFIGRVAPDERAAANWLLTAGSPAVARDVVAYKTLGSVAEKRSPTELDDVFSRWDELLPELGGEIPNR